MIKQLYRFRGHRSVSAVRGRVLHGRYMSLKVGKSNRKTSRMAVVVSKKVAPKAISRNRIRRRIYEIARKSNVLEKTESTNFVVYIKTQDLASISHEKIEKELLSLLKNSAPVL